MLQLAIMAAGILLAQTPSPKDSLSTGAQPFGLKGDVLGETLQEFRTRNDRVIALGKNGLDHLRFAPLLLKTKHLPLCTNDKAVPKPENWPLDAEKSRLTEEEERAGVVKCIAALSLNDDLDFDDGPTVAGIRAYRTVYSFFKDRLYQIQSELSEGDYPVLRSAFTAKYGAPRTAAVAVYGNAFGAKTVGQQLVWTNAISQISIGQLDAKQHADPYGDLLATMNERIRSTKAQTEALGLSPDEEQAARVYDKAMHAIRETNKSLEGHNNVLLTIWHKALGKECEAAGAVKDRAKDL